MNLKSPQFLPKMFMPHCMQQCTGLNGYYPFFGNSLPGKIIPFKFLGLLKN